MAATEPAASGQARPRRRPSAKALGLLVVLALGAYGLDQLVKALIVANLREGEVVPLLGEVLQLRFVLNSGAAFSLGSGYTWVLSVVAVAVIVFIVIFSPRIRSLGWATMFGLVLGGALGNATDRLFRPPGFGIGHVVDYIQVWGFPAIFNIADIAITCSMGLFVLLTIRGTRLDGTREQSAAATQTDDAATDAAPAAPGQEPRP